MSARMGAMGETVDPIHSTRVLYMYVCRRVITQYRPGYKVGSRNVKGRANKKKDFQLSAGRLDRLKTF